MQSKLHAGTLHSTTTPDAQRPCHPKKVTSLPTAGPKSTPACPAACTNAKLGAFRSNFRLPFTHAEAFQPLCTCPRPWYPPMQNDPQHKHAIQHLPNTQNTRCTNTGLAQASAFRHQNHCWSLVQCASCVLVSQQAGICLGPNYQAMQQPYKTRCCAPA
jgi:hypothetical protein